MMAGIESSLFRTRARGVTMSQMHCDFGCGNSYRLYGCNVANLGFDGHHDIVQSWAVKALDQACKA